MQLFCYFLIKLLNLKIVLFSRLKLQFYLFISPSLSRTLRSYSLFTHLLRLLFCQLFLSLSLSFFAFSTFHSFLFAIFFSLLLTSFSPPFESKASFTQPKHSIDVAFLPHSMGWVECVEKEFEENRINWNEMWMNRKRERERKRTVIILPVALSSTWHLLSFWHSLIHTFALQTTVTQICLVRVLCWIGVVCCSVGDWLDFFSTFINIFLYSSK